MKRSFILYDDWKPLFDSLEDDEAGKLIKGLFAMRNGEGSRLEFTSSTTKALYDFMKTTILRDSEKYAERCEKNRQIALRREADKRANDNDSGLHD